MTFVRSQKIMFNQFAEICDHSEYREQVLRLGFSDEMINTIKDSKGLCSGLVGSFLLGAGSKKDPAVDGVAQFSLDKIIKDIALKKHREFLEDEKKALLLLRRAYNFQKAHKLSRINQTDFHLMTDFGEEKMAKFSFKLKKSYIFSVTEKQFRKKLAVLSKPGRRIYIASPEHATGIFNNSLYLPNTDGGIKFYSVIPFFFMSRDIFKELRYNPSVPALISVKIFVRTGDVEDEDYPDHPTFLADSVKNPATKLKRTSLHMAAYIGCKSSLEYYLYNNTNIDAKDEQGQTAFDIALQNIYLNSINLPVQTDHNSQSNYFDCLRLLLKAGANSDIQHYLYKEYKENVDDFIKLTRVVNQLMEDIRRPVAQKMKSLVNKGLLTEEEVKKLDCCQRDNLGCSRIQEIIERQVGAEMSAEDKCAPLSESKTPLKEVETKVKYPSGSTRAVLLQMDEARNLTYDQRQNLKCIKISFITNGFLTKKEALNAAPEKLIILSLLHTTAELLISPLVHSIEERRARRPSERTESSLEAYLQRLLKEVKMNAELKRKKLLTSPDQDNCSIAFYSIFLFPEVDLEAKISDEVFKKIYFLLQAGIYNYIKLEESFGQAVMLVSAKFEEFKNDMDKRQIDDPTNKQIYDDVKAKMRISSLSSENTLKEIYKILVRVGARHPMFKGIANTINGYYNGDILKKYNDCMISMAPFEFCVEEQESKAPLGCLPRMW